MPHDQEAAELWVAFKRGDRAAYGSLVKMFYKTLFSYGTKFSADTAVVEDCIQDLFLEIWQRREFLSDTEHVKFYLLKSLRRKIHHELDKLQSRQHDPLDDKQTLDFLGEFSIETTLIEIETAELHQKKLHQILAKLTKREREVIYLKFYQEMDYEQIAGMMSINYQSVRNLIHTAIRELKKAWYQ